MAVEVKNPKPLNPNPVNLKPLNPLTLIQHNILNPGPQCRLPLKACWPTRQKSNLTIRTGDSLNQAFALRRPKQGSLRRATCYEPAFILRRGEDAV